MHAKNSQIHKFSQAYHGWPRSAVPGAGRVGLCWNPRNLESIESIEHLVQRSWHTTRPGGQPFALIDRYQSVLTKLYLNVPVAIVLTAKHVFKYTKDK